VVVGNGDGVAVGVFVAAVAPFSAGETESISFKGFDEFAGRNSARDRTVSKTAGKSAHSNRIRAAAL
jgi:hypothetical protein